MDIFEMAAQSVKIQEANKHQEELEENEKNNKEKSYPLDIKDVIVKVAQKDYGWLGRDDKKYTSEQKIKGFQPFILNLWMSKMVSSDKGRKITALDRGYSVLLQRLNTEFNAHIYTAPKELCWLLACTINPYELNNFNMDWIKAAKKNKASKYDNRVIDHLSKELFSSRTKIVDMIEMGLISDEDMKAIAKDYDTLEKPKKGLKK